MLAKGAALLRKTDESAYSIVPSRTSYRTKDRNSRTSVESTELIYRELNIDDDLFTSRVYKRNYRPPADRLQTIHQHVDEDESLDSRSVVIHNINELIDTRQRPHLARLLSNRGRRRHSESHDVPVSEPSQRSHGFEGPILAKERRPGKYTSFRLERPPSPCAEVAHKRKCPPRWRCMVPRYLGCARRQMKGILERLASNRNTT